MLLGDVQRVVLVELDVRRAGHLHLRAGGDDLGVEVFRHADERLHDALHVHHHRLDRAGQDRQLLVQEVARGGDALAHHDLVGGAADAGQVDAVRALGLGVGDQLGVLDRGHDHLGEGRFVAVDDDVDLLLFQAAEVDLTDLGAGGAEEDVGDVGRPHGAAPAVGQRGADRCQQDVAGVLVVAHVRAVEDFHDLAVDAARGHALFLPDRLALGRRGGEVAQLAALLAELADRLVRHVQGHLHDRCVPWSRCRASRRPRTAWPHRGLRSPGPRPTRPPAG